MCDYFQDPSEEDELKMNKNKDEKPEKTKKESEDEGSEDSDNEPSEDVSKDKVETDQNCTNDSDDFNSVNINKDDVNNSEVDSDNEDLDSVSTEVTLTTTINQRPDPNLIASISRHISKLQELRDSTKAEDAKASGDVTMLKGQYERASNAADHAKSEAKCLRTSIHTAEMYTSNRSFVVAELQQSTARLGAAGTIIKQQLEHLHGELVKNSFSLVQEKSEKMALQGEYIIKTYVLTVGNSWCMNC